MTQQNVGAVCYECCNLKTVTDLAGAFLSFYSFFLFVLPYALTDILGRLAQRLLVQDSKKGRIIVQRFKSIKVKDKNR